MKKILNMTNKIATSHICHSSYIQKQFHKYFSNSLLIVGSIYNEKKKLSKPWMFILLYRLLNSRNGKEKWSECERESNQEIGLDSGFENFNFLIIVLFCQKNFLLLNNMNDDN